MDRKKSDIPPGWEKEYLGQADLKRAFDALDGYTHFYAEALRGRIRSLELDHDAAWVHLDQAAELSALADSSVPNLLRKFFLSTYSFDNALWERRLDNAGTIPPLWSPKLSPALSEKHPELHTIVRLRKRVEGLLRLHLGEAEKAADLFRSLLKEESGKIGVESAYTHSSLAAALHNLGDADGSKASLENAGLVLQATGSTLSRARVAAVLSAFYSYLDEKTEARDWLLFLERLQCPRATKELFQRRATKVLERCVDEDCLLPL